MVCLVSFVFLESREVHKASLVYKMQGDRRQIEKQNKNVSAMNRPQDSRHQHHQNKILRRVIFFFLQEDVLLISTTKLLL